MGRSAPSLVRIRMFSKLSNDSRSEKHSLSLGVVQSRHPGRYPKLEGSTLSHPTFEPRTEHHAFATGLLTVTIRPRLPSGSRRRCSCASHDRQVSGNFELRTCSILPWRDHLLQGEPARAPGDRPTISRHGVSCGPVPPAVWLPRHGPTWVATRTLHSVRRPIA